MAKLRILNSTKSNKLDTYWSLCANIVERKIGTTKVETIGAERYFLSTVAQVETGVLIDSVEWASSLRKAED